MLLEGGVTVPPPARPASEFVVPDAIRTDHRNVSSH